MISPYGRSDEEHERERLDQALFQQVLLRMGLTLPGLLEAGTARPGRPPVPIPLGEIGRTFVEAKRAEEMFADRPPRGGLNPGISLAPRVSPSAVGNRGMDALLGGMRVVELLGGGSSMETPSFEPPPPGALSQAQVERARHPAVRLLDRLGRTLGPPTPLPVPSVGSMAPQSPTAASDGEMARLRSALAQQAQTIPGIQDPRMGIRRPRFRLSRRQLPDIREQTPWALIEAQLPFPLE